ncbi:MAG TPA: LysR family transcriptional regulator [Candidatus Lachnoclostridium pullistercoris]|uniref:LysR family transcriptional regulator n=1 Tax=Candidatus Lachnoclostridium pullistercoris TaxID=2838632 RepID=A0A9D2PDL4_9FIRM|nr:LysR family transcriptional regulator [Candidatus Lachnoclostridium pullistercoris]
MNVKDYRYIIEIADREGISQAAEVLCITQSALTKFLQRTEKELGISLFYRKNNRLILTEAGRYYVEKGREIVRLDYELEEGISKIVENKEKHIRIGCSIGREDNMIQNVIAPFMKKNPGVCVQVLGGSTSTRLTMVEKNELDFALVTSRDYRPGLSYDPVGEAALVLAVPEDSPVIERAVKKEGDIYPTVELKDWIEYPFIQLSAVTASGKMIRDFFKAEGVKPMVRLEVNSVRSAVIAVEAGIGNTVFWEVPRKKRRVKYLYLKELRPAPQRMYVAYRTDYYMSSAGRALIRLFQQAGQKNE